MNASRRCSCRHSVFAGIQTRHSYLSDARRCSCTETRHSSRIRPMLCARYEVQLPTQCVCRYRNSGDIWEPSRDAYWVLTIIVSTNYRGCIAHSILSQPFKHGTIVQDDSTLIYTSAGTSSTQICKPSFAVSVALSSTYTLTRCPIFYM